MLRKLLVVSIAVGVASLGSGVALAQYPPPTCTAEERAAFNRQQQQEKQQFQNQRQQEREFFRSTGPHSPKERAAFNRQQQREKQQFQRNQQRERKAFNDACRTSRPIRSGPSVATSPVAPPTLTVGHILLALAGVGLVLLVRRRVRSVASR